MNERHLDRYARRQEDSAPEEAFGADRDGFADTEPFGRGSGTADAGQEELRSTLASLKAELYNDVLSPKTQQFIDSQILDLRTRIEAGDDFQIGMDVDGNLVGMTADDGRALRTLSDVLAEIEELDELAREMAACVA